jgi:RNA polymerase sigma-70 factor (ECF subfamily)
MSDLKKVNAIVNDRIQELAVLVKDKRNKNRRTDMNELMKLILPKLRFYVLGIVSSSDDSEDVLFNACEKICVSIDSFNPAFRFTTWSYNIAKNEAFTWLNKRPKNQIDIDEHFNAIANRMIDDTDEMIEREMNREAVISDVYEEIQRVSIEDENLMLLEKDINCRKCKEIAELYDMCENTVKTRIRAGRKRVRERVMEKHPDFMLKIVTVEI